MAYNVKLSLALHFRLHNILSYTKFHVKICLIKFPAVTYYQKLSKVQILICPVAFVRGAYVKDAQIVRRNWEWQGVTSLTWSHSVPNIMPQWHNRGITVMFQVFQTFAVNGGEWSATHASCFNHREKEKPWTGNYPDHRADLQTIPMRRAIPCQECKTWRWSLYWLCFPCLPEPCKLITHCECLIISFLRLWNSWHI